MVAGRRVSRDVPADSLLDELAALRELDRLRRAFPADSAAHAIAAEQVVRRSRALMDRFRELQADSRDGDQLRVGMRLPVRQRRQPRPRAPLTRMTDPMRGTPALH